MSRPVAYGQAYGGKLMVDIACAASQPFQANGGKWVHLATASMLATLSSGANTANLVGWADVGTLSSSSTAGNDIVPVNLALDAAYEMPINATQTETQLRQLVGKLCDIEIASAIQYADYDASSDNSLQIIGYKYYGSEAGEQSLICRLNHGAITSYTGV